MGYSTFFCIIGREGNCIMKIIVTGGAGQLGFETCRTLVKADVNVVSVDRSALREHCTEQKIHDLCNREEAYHALEGADVVIHAGNYPNKYSGDPQTVCTGNCTININVFQAAAELGISKIIFASSIQTFTGSFGVKNKFPPPPYFPFDGDMPFNPANTYALSKVMSEKALEFYAEQYDISCIAVRFPWLTHNDWRPRNRIKTIAELVAEYREKCKTMHGECGTYMYLDDAADFMKTLVEKDLPGYRRYFTASGRQLADISDEELVNAFFPDVPWHRPQSECSQLWDAELIEQELGWAPLPRVDL